MSIEERTLKTLGEEEPIIGLWHFLFPLPPIVFLLWLHFPLNLPVLSYYITSETEHISWICILPLPETSFHLF